MHDRMHVLATQTGGGPASGATAAQDPAWHARPLALQSWHEPPPVPQEDADWPPLQKPFEQQPPHVAGVQAGTLASAPAASWSPPSPASSTGVEPPPEYAAQSSRAEHEASPSPIAPIAPHLLRNRETLPAGGIDPESSS
jgi:hypothetical protein